MIHQHKKEIFITISLKIWNGLKIFHFPRVFGEVTILLKSVLADLGMILHENIGSRYNFHR